MSSIKETLEKIKPFYTILLLVVVAGLFFTLGRFSAMKSETSGVKVDYSGVSQTSSVINSSITTSTTTSTQVKAPTPTTGAVIGSKSGKKYYFPWCGTVKRIKPENQVHFASIEEAKKAGFVPGGNCKGLK